MTDDRRAVLHGGELDALELLLSGLTGLPSYGLPAAAPSDVTSLAIPGPPAEPGSTVELLDPDGTPVASVRITGSRAAERPAHSWVAGRVTPLRPFGHGPSHPRLTSGSRLDGRVVALFGGEVRAPDVLTALRIADGRPLDVVFCGSSVGATTARALDDLDAVASMTPDSRLWFVPDGPALRTDDALARVCRSLGAAEIVDLRHRRASTATGAVVVFTGLSGSGKSTVARALVEHLHAHADRTPVLLDGDDVRRQLSGELGFSAEDRDRNLQRVAWVGARVAEAGGIAVCAPIAPFAASRAEMRRKVEPRSPFILIHVSTPLEVAEARDRKGLYAKARAGLISDFTGIDSPYEDPVDADAAIDTSSASVEECVAVVMSALRSRGVLPEGPSPR
ncbi:adenylyl-sulfate kinase [Microbacterium sp. GCS4]|uniref:adenylyl-sulfate kinase n=1 Tax=Microbacterium sp. GCS4 TaxID=1692239 RepID=UPI0006816639|nr:adenylyl-sulfate kinase [Microbacterium sp. GCS4]